MENPHEKLIVSNAIEKLINAEDENEENSKIVISYLIKMNITSGTDIKYQEYGKNRNSMKGFTSEAGNVEIKDGKDELVEKRIAGIEPERVGIYKIKRHDDTDFTIYNFRKDTENPLENQDKHPTFLFRINPENSSPVSFSKFKLIKEKNYNLYFFKIIKRTFIEEYILGFFHKKTILQSYRFLITRKG